MSTSSRIRAGLGAVPLVAALAFGGVTADAATSPHASSSRHVASDLTASSTPSPTFGWVPGVALGQRVNALRDGQAGLTSVACASPGDCTAVGQTESKPFSYAQAPTGQALVATETAGVWDAGARVAVSLNRGDDAKLTSVACTSPGNCVAVGQFENGAKDTRALVVTQAHGRWNGGVEVARTLSTGSSAGLGSVSCSSAGNCAAVGVVSPAGYSDGGVALVVTETAGIWNAGIELPLGLSALDSVSCPANGQCTAVGWESTTLGGIRPIATISSDDVWGGPVVIGASLTPSKDESLLASVSCGAAGDCTAVGWADQYSSTSALHSQALVASEVSGVWRPAIEVARGVNAGRNAELNSVSCTSPVSCTAVGYFVDRLGRYHFLGVTESGRVWSAGSTIVEGPESARSGASMISVSCVAPRDCMAVGSELIGDYLEMVGTRLSGARWIQTTIVAHRLAQADGLESVIVPTAIACSPGLECAAVGRFADVTKFQGMVVDHR